MKNEMKNDRIDCGGGIFAIRKYKVTSDRAKFYTNKSSTHMTFMKIVKFSRPLTPSVNICPKFFHSLDLGRPVLNESPHLLQQTVEQQPHRRYERLKLKQKQNQVVSNSN